MSIEIQRQMLAEIKSEIQNIDRILNQDNDKVKDDLIYELYHLLCEPYRSSNLGSSI